MNNMNMNKSIEDIIVNECVFFTEIDKSIEDLYEDKSIEDIFEDLCIDDEL